VVWAAAMMAGNPNHKKKEQHKPQQGNDEQWVRCVSDGSPIVHFADIPTACISIEAIQGVLPKCSMFRQDKGAVGGHIYVSRSFSKLSSHH